MKYAVITGTSRGLGASIARQLMEKGVHIIGISRTENRQLANLSSHEASYQHVTCNLSNPAEVEKVFQKAADDVFKAGTEVVYLINNAGVVEPISRAGHYSGEELVHHVNTNLVAPMAACNLFMEAAEEKGVRFIAVNVTSGAADRSVYGWSAYSSSKAGLNRYTSTLALEQAEKETGNLAILFNPGIMDTDMQKDIRSTSKEAFKDVEKFQEYKESNSLQDTDQVAGMLVSILEKDGKIENGKTYSAYDF